MVIAGKIVDALTVMVAIGLGMMLGKKWQARMAMAVAGCAAMIWCGYYRHPKWLGGVPPVLVDLATFGLAYLGAHVSLNPPADNNKILKRLYVFVFAGLFVIGMAANGWQRSVEADKRDRLQQDQTDAEKRFSADLNIVKTSSTAILNLVAHPPAGMTTAQVASIAQHLLQKQQSNASSLSPPNLYDGLSNDELLLIAKATAKDIDDVMGAWSFQIKEEIEPRRRDQVYERDPAPDEDERNRLDAYFDKEVETANQKYGSQAKVLFIRAEALREVLVNRLAQKNSRPLPKDGTINDAFKGLAANGVESIYDGTPSKLSAQLLNLCQRLEKVSG